jgi:hypothetical protein
VLKRFKTSSQRGSFLLFFSQIKFNFNFAAVEDEEHLSLGPLDPQSTAQQHPLVVPALHVSPLAMLSPSQQSQPSSSSIPSVSPLIAAEQHFALAAAAAAAAASRPSVSGNYGTYGV